MTHSPGPCLVSVQELPSGPGVTVATLSSLLDQT